MKKTNLVNNATKKNQAYKLFFFCYCCILLPFDVQTILAKRAGRVQISTIFISLKISIFFFPPNFYVYKVNKPSNLHLHLA